jgi:mono/diheme cytochrome c family protein
MKRKRLVLFACGVFAATVVLRAADDGRQLYDQNCKTCHGANGEGNAKIAAVMKAEIKPLSAPSVQAKSDAELAKAITDGVGKMKPVKTLSAKQATVVVAFVRTLKK